MKNVCRIDSPGSGQRNRISVLVLCTGEGGTEVYDSESYIDIRHLEYWDECIDDSYKDNDIPAEVVMIPHKIRDVMK